MTEPMTDAEIIRATVERYRCCLVVMGMNMAASEEAVASTLEAVARLDRAEARGAWRPEGRSGDAQLGMPAEMMDDVLFTGRDMTAAYYEGYRSALPPPPSAPEEG